MTAPEAAAEARRRLRQWVRENHPDRGGDPDAFAAGLARHRRAVERATTGRAPAAATGSPAAGLSFHRRPRGVRGLLHTAGAALRRRRRRRTHPRVR